MRTALVTIVISNKNAFQWQPSRGGSVCSRELGSTPGGCLLLEGVCSGGGGGSAGGGVSAPGGVPGSGGGGCLLLGDVWSLEGGIPACTEADPPVNKMTDRCKNITFATLLRTVTKMHSNRIRTYRCRTLLSELSSAPTTRRRSSWIPTLWFVMTGGAG